MSRIRSTALAVLDRIYGFVEGGAPQEIELGLPVQLVHDTSREAEIGAAIGTRNALGFFIFGTTHVHPVGGEIIAAVVNPYTVLGALSTTVKGNIGLPDSFASTIAVWLFDTFAWSATPSCIVSVKSALFHTILPGSFGAPTTQLIYYGGDAFNVPNSTGSSDATSVSNMSANRPDRNVWPMLLPNGTVIANQTLATALTPGSIFVGHKCWLGPVGARPPGTA